jgi:hypothetical protein
MREVTLPEKIKIIFNARITNIKSPEIHVKKWFDMNIPVNKKIPEIITTIPM